MSLREYNRKRKFDQTPEPPGKSAPRKGDLRFVIQMHKASRLHFDFRLEMDGVFKSWAVPRGPSLNPTDQRLAVYVEDHPIPYGSFEGIIPKGNYGAGTVMIWDHGTYEERGGGGEKAMLKGLEKGHITFVLDGEKLKGEFALIRFKDGDQKSWLLVKKRDEHSSYKIRKEEDRSAATGRTLSEITAQAEKKGEVWLPKRAKEAKLQVLTKKASAAKKAAPTSLLTPKTLAAAKSAKPRKGISDPVPRRVLPMLPRQEKSKELGKGWLYTPLTDGLRAISEAEGKRVSIHSKKLLSFTRKFPKITQALEAANLNAVLDGEISRDGSEYSIFDLLYIDGQDLRDAPLNERLEKLQKLKLTKNPLKTTETASKPPKAAAILARNPSSPYASGVSSDWLQIEGDAPKTSKETARSPVFTHLKKLYWRKEKITKEDLINYYRSVAPALLPHLEDRPMSLHRFPDGIEAQGFYQKDYTGYKPRWLKTERIYSESAEKSVDYVVCDNEETLLHLANLGCIEMNPWFSRTQKIDNPDYLVIDLDPDRQKFSQVVEVALECHKLLEKIGAENFCKTSGATGLHVCVPLHAQFEFEKAREFAEAVCQEIHTRFPSMTTLERAPGKRGGRMYLDFMQNRIGQTLASVYSVRPRPGAPVSTPLKWSEVTPKLDPTAYTIHNSADRLDRLGDLWEPLLKRQVDIAQCLKKLLTHRKKS